MDLYPLRFQPIFRRYLWGGRRLGTLLGKPIGPGHDYAECWEVVDRGADQSLVAAGPLQGASLGQLVAERGRELLGRHAPQPRFPLLWKFLDSQQPLSVQVHPDDARAARLSPPDLGKTEAWVILAAEPESVLYAGLKAGVDRAALAAAVRAGRTAECLHAVRPRPGDCLFIPAGVVHALGAGLVVAEIQQASDTTYRLYDWDRVGPEGRPRPLHIEEGLACVNDEGGPVNPQLPQPTGLPHAQRLVACDKFVLERWRLDRRADIGGDDRARILCVVAGAARVAGDAIDRPLALGETMLLPASCGATELEPAAGAAAELLVAYLP